MPQSGNPPKTPSRPALAGRLILESSYKTRRPKICPNRYPISTPAPRPVKLSDFGMARDQDGGDLTFETTIRGEVSLEEFKAMFGPNRNIVGALAYSSTSSDGGTITLTAEDVLATEGTNTMQHLIIDGLLDQIGMDPMEVDEIGRRALGINQISPDAVRFLMEMRDRAKTPQEADVIAELRRLEEAGLGMIHFCQY